MVLAYVARRTRQPDLALDVVAETFARALEHREQYDPSRGPAIAWLLGIARNEIVGGMRRGRVADEYRMRLGMAPIGLDDEGTATIESHMSLDLMTALSALPSAQRELIVRRFLVDQSYRDIAREVGCSEQVIRKRVSRGLSALRQALQGDA